MRRIITLLTAGLALAMSAAPVAAAAPEHTRLEPLEFVIEGSCDFGVHYKEVRVSGRQSVFFDGGGNVTKVVIRGNFVIELRNVDTDESMRLNISGQFFITDVFAAHGRNLLFTPFPEPFIMLAVGNVVLDVSEGLAIVNPRGRLVDICARLAA